MYSNSERIDVGSYPYQQRSDSHGESFREQVLNHRGFNDALEAIKRVHKTAGTRNPRAMFLSGHSTIGKSTLLDAYAERFKPTRTEDGLVVPVVRVDLPPDVERGSLLSELLLVLGSPSWGVSNVHQKGHLAKQLLRGQQTQLIIFDDMHHALRAKKHAVKPQSVADELRILMRQTQCAMVLAGLPGVERLITEGDQGGISEDQLGKRMLRGARLEPFVPTDPDWMRVLKTYQQLILVKSSVEFHKNPDRERFWLATRGFIGTLGDLLEQALYCSSGSRLTLGDLVCGYELIQEKKDIEYNPFTLTSQQTLRKLAEVTA